jgi:hypothetical protein
MAFQLAGSEIGRTGRAIEGRPDRCGTPRLLHVAAERRSRTSLASSFPAGWNPRLRAWLASETGLATAITP